MQQPNNIIHIGAHGRTELAQMYYPHLCPGRAYALLDTIRSEMANIKPGTNKTAIRLINCLFMMIYFLCPFGRLLFLIKELR